MRSVPLLQPRLWPIWDVLFPPLCAICERALDPEDILFCKTCGVEAPVADLRDLHKLNHVDMVVAGYRFGGPDIVRGTVHALKYDGVRPLAAWMAKKLIPRMTTHCMEADVVWTAVPLFWVRRLFRGFNQSQLLAVELARIAAHDSPQILLKRIRHTPTQTARTYRERARNVKNAFAAVPGISMPKNILLIDDVMTTGATMDECARVLKAAGAKWVGALAFGLAHQVKMKTES
jgi:ComF family protein